MDSEQTYSTVAPTATFRSTSTLQQSGSAYAASPMLGADGTATHNGYYTQVQAPGSGPRKVGPPTPEGDPTPLGDALIPLLIMAIIYMIVAYRRKTKVSDLCI